QWGLRMRCRPGAIARDAAMSALASSPLRRACIVDEATHDERQPEPALEATPRRLDLGRLRPRRSARPLESADAAESERRSVRSEGRACVLPQPAARLPR